MSRRFIDQHVLVTGGAQGLGFAMARRFAEEGGVVHVADVNLAAIEKALFDLKVDGLAATGHIVDVADSAAVNSWISEVGMIDVLVNNAGVIRDNRIEHISDEDWDAVIGVNLTGAFNCIRATLPVMKKSGYGRILSFSSMSWRGNFGQANYVAAKAGIVGLTRNVSLEGAKYGITANAIAPGLIKTPMLASMNDQARELLTKKVPVGHLGEPEDIASAACFLTAPEARYITGVVLDVDGGIGVGASVR